MRRKIFNWAELISGDYSHKVDLGAFTHLRLFHCCRPTSVESYYAESIRVVPLAELADRFRKNYTDLSPAVVEAAIAALNRETREERVDAVLDLRFLIQHASHYLVQGSETIKAFARALPSVDGCDPTARLKSIGRPTAFLIDVPLDAVDKQDLRDLQTKLDVLAEQGTDYVCDDGDMIDFTTSFASGVPAEWIVGHGFVDEAADPDDRGKSYRYAAV